MSRRASGDWQKKQKEKIIVIRNKGAKPWLDCNIIEKKRVAKKVFDRGYQQYLKSIGK